MTETVDAVSGAGLERLCSDRGLEHLWVHTAAVQRPGSGRRVRRDRAR